ncbi:hypothetical protein HYH02_008201 [Chlamydomonas schloesseri]|uniref:Uncharacterized protein n=1 Tax=Chlamydomonas schloesseri TaxID=2026947 RepID=A0A835WFS4_9CHLO|nr:hypothetical protein HYH02_008201 [Chlamydomonas schloesseri]|eukprot:KAG2446627.1 hypothetical protein HYH02_008201 [Chlamydomonas schloesseri]
MHFAAPPEGILLLSGQHGITYKPALLPEDAGASNFSSEGDENGGLDRRSSFDCSVTGDCSFSSSSFWLGSTASSVRSRPASIFFGGDVPSTPSGLGDAFLAHSPCAVARAAHGGTGPTAFSRRSGEFATHSAGSYGLVSHASSAAACTLGPLLEDLPLQFCAARRTALSGQLDADCGCGPQGSGDGDGGGGASGVDSSVGAYEREGQEEDDDDDDGTEQEDGADADLDVELDDDSAAHLDAGERKLTPRGAGAGAGRKAAAPASSYAAAVAPAAAGSPHTPLTASRCAHHHHQHHHPHGRHSTGGTTAAAVGGASTAAAASSAAALLTAADLSNVAAAAAAAAAAASMGASSGRPSPWATSLLNRARAAESRAARLETRLREQRGAMEELQRQLGERDSQLAALRAELAALQQQQQQQPKFQPGAFPTPPQQQQQQQLLLHSPQPAHAASRGAHPHGCSQLHAQLAAAGVRLRSSSMGGACIGGGAGISAGAGGSFTCSGVSCDGGSSAGVGRGSAGSYTCGGMVAAPPCYNAAVGPLAAAAAALTTPTTPEMHHHLHAPYSTLNSAPSGDLELGELCDADRLSPAPRRPALSPSPSLPLLAARELAAADVVDTVGVGAGAGNELGSSLLLPPMPSLPRLDTPQMSDLLLPSFSASSTAPAGAIAASVSPSAGNNSCYYPLGASLAGTSAVAAGPLPPVQEEDSLHVAASASARTSTSGDGAASPVTAPAAPTAAAPAASPFAALASEALHLHLEADANAPPCRNTISTNSTISSSAACLAATASLPPGGDGLALARSPSELDAARRRTDAAHRALLVSASQAHRLAAALEAERAASRALREELRDWRSCCLDNHKELAAARRRLAAAHQQQ